MIFVFSFCLVYVHRCIGFQDVFFELHKQKFRLLLPDAPKEQRGCPKQPVQEEGAGNSDVGTEEEAGSDLRPAQKGDYKDTCRDKKSLTHQQVSVKI